MSGYDAGPQFSSGGFRLAGNENPFPPLPGVMEAAHAAADLGRYPDAGVVALRGVLAERHGVSTAEVHVSGGSVAIIYQFLESVAGPGREVVLASRTFEAYPKAIAVSGATAVRVPNLVDEAHDLDGMLHAITDSTAAVLVCSPNNPTGNTLSSAALTAFLEGVPSSVAVLLDEAYIEFVNRPDAHNGVEMLRRFPNLFVLRTFSKAYGLAGLRVGYVVGAEDVLAGIRRAAVPFLVSDLAQRAAIASLLEEDALAGRVGQLVAAREQLLEQVRRQGWDIPDSGGNFFWLPAGPRTEEVAALFAEHGLLVRAFPNAGVRVTVAEPESYAAVVAASEAALSLTLDERVPAPGI